MEETSEGTARTLPRILRKAQVVEVTGLSSVSIWRLERRGDFPRRRRLIGSAVGWLEDEVREWVESRPVVPLPEDSEE